MRTVFVFPPQASPSYVPLGLAALSAYVKSCFPHTRFTAIDLNLHTWERELKKVEPDLDLSSYMCENRESFFEESVYSRHFDLRVLVGERIEMLYTDAKVYIETEVRSAELVHFLSTESELLLATDPELIGFSIMYPKQLVFALALAKHVKSASPSISIIFGGATMSFLEGTELLDACPFVDALVLGEGEPAFGKLLSGSSRSEVSGLLFRGARGPVQNHKSQTLSMMCMPFPDFSDFSISRYWNPSPVLPVLFSRGCRWRKCRFCAHNFSFSGYRMQGTMRFVDQLEEYGKLYGAKHFYFADQYIDVLDLEQIADEILSRDLHLAFHCMGRPIRENSYMRLEKLHRAGLQWMSWGVETGSQRLLDLCGKGTFVKEIKQVLRDSHRAGINNLLMMMYGLPTSTDDDLEQTFEFFESLSDEIDEMKESVFCLIKGTGFARNAKMYGMQVTGANELLHIGDRQVHSFRLNFREICLVGSTRPPRGPLELALWEKRKRWLFEDTLLSRMPAEHYLLAVSRKHLHYQDHMLAAGSA